MTPTAARFAVIRAAFERLGWNMTPVNVLAARVEELERERDERPFIGGASLINERAETAEARVRELEEALRQALDCKGSYEGVVSERGGYPAICTKCAESARRALGPEDES